MATKPQQWNSLECQQRKQQPCLWYCSCLGISCTNSGSQDVQKSPVRESVLGDNCPPKKKKRRGSTLKPKKPLKEQSELDQGGPTTAEISQMVTDFRRQQFPQIDIGKFAKAFDKILDEDAKLVGEGDNCLDHPHEDLSRWFIKEYLRDGAPSTRDTYRNEGSGMMPLVRDSYIRSVFSENSRGRLRKAATRKRPTLVTPVKEPKKNGTMNGASTGVSETKLAQSGSCDDLAPNSKRRCARRRRPLGTNVAARMREFAALNRSNMNANPK